MKKQKSLFNESGAGFTLAEILMISAIVALIGSVILIFSKGAIEKARIAKLLQFSASIHHALGAYLIAEYKFEESGDDTCPNPPDQGYDDFCDTSGNGNHGEQTYWQPTEPKVSRVVNDKIPQLGQAAYFNGLSSITLPDLTRASDSGVITIQSWIKPEGFPQTDYDDPIIGYITTFIFGIDREKRLCLSNDNPPNNYRFCSNTSVFETGKWYHVAVTYGKSEVKLFVNAEIVGLGLTDGIPFTIGSALLLIGEQFPNFPYKYKGYIDELRIYSEALSSTQIKKLYVEGAKKHGLLFKE